MFKFKLPIGDWSDDGHGKCDWFTIESAKPVEDVREAYFAMVKKHKHLQLGEAGPCRNDSELPKAWLEKAQIKPKDVGLDEDFEGFDYDCDPPKSLGFYAPDSVHLARIFVLLLNRFDPSLDLRLVEDNELPMFPFYGYDKKKRHITYMGYGLFR